MHHDTLKFPCTTIKREGKTLYLFADKPFWFVGHPSIEEIIDYFQGNLSKDNLIEKLVSDWSYTKEDSLELVVLIHRILNEAKLFSQPEKSKAKELMSVKDRFALPVLNITKNCNLFCRH